jgi:hypothetical protein
MYALSESGARLIPHRSHWGRISSAMAKR